MKRTGLVFILPILAILLSIPLAAADKSDPVEKTDGQKWTIDLSGSFLVRAAGMGVPVASRYSMDEELSTANTALDAWKPGASLKVGRSWGRLGAEVRLTMRAGSSASAFFDLAGGYNAPRLDSAGRTSYIPYGDITVTAGNSGQAVKGLEAGLTYDLSEAVSVHAGFRYLSIDEDFVLSYDLNRELDSMFQGPSAGGSPTSYMEARNRAEMWSTGNRMMGGQIGLRVDFLRLAGAGQGRFTLRGRTALTIFGNRVKTSYVRSIDSEVRDNIGVAKNKAVLGADCGLQAGFRLSRLVELHAGYDLMWLGSTAQADHQTATTYEVYYDQDTDHIDFRSLVLQGATVGVTLRF